MDPARQLLLEACFFEDEPLPANMTEEERRYIMFLSRKWDHVLLDLYGRIILEDNDHREAEHSPDKA